MHVKDVQFNKGKSWSSWKSLCWELCAYTFLKIPDGMLRGQPLLVQRHNASWAIFTEAEDVHALTYFISLRHPMARLSLPICIVMRLPHSCDRVVFNLVLCSTCRHDHRRTRHRDSDTMEVTCFVCCFIYLFPFRVPTCSLTKSMRVYGHGWMVYDDMSTWAD